LISKRYLEASESGSHSKVCLPIDGKVSPFVGLSRPKQEGLGASVIVGVSVISGVSVTGCGGNCVGIRDGIGVKVNVALGDGVAVFVLVGWR